MCIKAKANTAQTQLYIFTNHNIYYTLEPQENKQELSVINLAMHAAHFKPAY